MGATSGRKALAILANTERVIAIEALAAAQALELRAPLKTAPATGAVVELVRDISPKLTDDRPLSRDIEAVHETVASGRLIEAVEASIGPLD